MRHDHELRRLVPLAAGALPTGPAVYVAVTENRPLIWAMLAVIVLAIAMSVCFFFPEHTIVAVRDHRRRRWAIKSGFIGSDDMRWLLDRHPSGTVAASLKHDLVSVTCHRLARTSTNDACRLGGVWVRWIRTGNDPALLTDALRAGLHVEDLRDHLDGTQPLAHDAVATLAALSSHPEAS